jgi:hypothetical protein
MALDVVLPVPSSVVALLAVAMLGSVGGYLVIFIGLCLGAGLGYALGAGYFRMLSSRVWPDTGRIEVLIRGLQLPTGLALCRQGMCWCWNSAAVCNNRCRLTGMAKPCMADLPGSAGDC